jgi:hypothetical protein
MSGIFGGGTISTEAEKLATIRIQTSAYGRVIPVVYGTARIAGNLLWYNDFVRTENTTQQKSGGIFGIGAVKTQNTTYLYRAAIALGLCEGPITGIDTVWSEKAYAFYSALSGLGFVLFLGASPQSIWSWVTANHPTEAIPYDGIAYLANPSWPLDGNASLPNQSFEIGGLLQIGGTPIPIVDANPGTIIQDVLTNVRYGLGWDASRIDVVDFTAYCTAAAIFVSPAYTEQQPASAVLKQLIELALADAIWSGGKAKIIPYADAVITGVDENGDPITWTPPSAVFDLTDDDFLVPKDSGEPPVRMRRKPPSDVHNVRSVQYEPRYGPVVGLGPTREKSYNTSVQEARDDALIALYGERRGQPAAFPMIRDDDLARATAQRLLQRGTAVLNQYEFRLGWRHVLLEPMDWGTITDAQLGLVQHAVRIIETSEDEYGTISVIAEDYPGAGGLVPGTVAGGASDGGGPNTYADPDDVEAPVIFEAPGSLASTSAAELWIAVTGADPNWGGCNVWMSTDGGSTYRKIAVQPTGSRYGALTALLAAWGSAPTLDTTHTLAVALLGARDTTLTSVTSGEASAGVTLCYVGGATREFLAFQTATLTGAAAYNLTTLARALRGSTDGSHASGAPFVRCDETLVRIPFPAGFPAGTTVYFKFTSFNLFGSNEQSLAGVVAYPFTFQNIGGPAGGNTTDALVAQLPFFDAVDDVLSVPAVPAVATEIDSGMRKRAYLAGIKSARIAAMVATAVAGTALKLSYSTNNGASWVAIGTTCSVAATGAAQSLFFALPAAMAADVLLKLETTGGDGVSTLELSSAALQYSALDLS